MVVIKVPIVKSAFFIILIHLVFGSAKAQVKTFNNSVSEFWEDALNWTPSGTPSINDSVIIDHPVIIPHDYVANANSIDILSNGELIVNHKNDTSARLHIIGNLGGSGIINNGRLINHGEITIFNHQTGIVNQGILRNELRGIIDIYSIEYSFVHNMDSILNRGQIYFSRPNSSGSSVNYYPLLNEGFCINKGYWLLDSMDYGGIMNKGGAALFQNEDSLIINNFAQSGGVLWHGIYNLDGFFINKYGGYIKMSNDGLVVKALNIERSIFENYGDLVIEDSYSSMSIYMSSDGILRNEGTVHISDVIGGIHVPATGAFYQYPSGEIIIEDFTGDALSVDILAIFDLQGLFEIR